MPTMPSPAGVMSTTQMPSPTLVAGPSLVKRQAAAKITPYIFPPDCTFQYQMTARSGKYQASFGSREETYLYINKASNTHWQTCQPPGATKGYHSVTGGLASVYRGSVCPAGWVASEVGMASQDSTRSKSGLPMTWSTAKCCQKGDSLVDNAWGINHSTIQDEFIQAQICVSTKPYTQYYSRETYASYSVNAITAWPSTYTQTISDGSVTTVRSYTAEEYTTTIAPWTEGRAFYPPFSIEWVEEDNVTLNPTWPVLTSNMRLPTWTPDMKLDSLNGRYDHQGAGPYRIYNEPSMPRKIAIPVIAVLSALLGLALLGIAFVLFRARKGGIRTPRREKGLDVDLGLPLGDDVGSTAHLSGQAGDDMELRERDAPRR